MSSKSDFTDVEKHPAEAGAGNISYEKRPSYVLPDGAVPGESFEIGNTFAARCHRLAGKLGIEQRGIERVPEDERHDTNMLNVSTMWLSANMVVSSFAIGVLARSIWYLGFVDAVLTCLFFNLLGVMSVCFFSSFGAKFGLRQMVLSRFWFGWHGVKLIAVFNILACVGWSSVNVIVGAQLINAVNNNVPGWVGILIIAFCTLLVTVFGYKIVHIYEFWSWIPTTIVFLITIGEFARSGAFNNVPMGYGTSEMGGVLSFGGVVFGFATGWTSYAADYTVYQPSTQSKRKIFGWTWIGLIIPLLFTEMLGIALMTASNMDKDAPNSYYQGYLDAGSGGLIGAVLFPPLGTFGKFCVILLALSIIANNCPNIYSVSLTMQVLGRWTQRVPRFVWTVIATGVYIAIAIPGYFYFETILENFMDFIGYWLAIYQSIALTEHFIFKKGFKGYNPEFYDHPKELPPGMAAIGAFFIGIVGMVLGMSQVWFVGPIGLAAGQAPYGGDVGFEVAAAFAIVAYLIFRPIELKYFHR